MRWSNSVFRWTVAIVVTVLDVAIVDAFPSSAGSCISGTAAVGGSHRTNAVRFEGTLADIGVEVKIANVSLTTDTLIVETGEHTLEVISALHDYAGILLRIESSDGSMDLSSAIIPGTNTKAAMTCIAPVGGVDHEDSAPKRISTATVRIDESSEIYLDITVVGMNNDTASVFGYTRYQVKFTNQTTFESMSGSGFASDSPSDVPSEISSDTPSDGPSDSPSSVPITDSTQQRQRHLMEEDRTLSRLNLREYLKLVLANLGDGATTASDLPSISPTFLPSDVPSINPSDVPSLFPSTLPSDIPSTVPSDIPSTVPSDFPSSVPSDLPSSLPSDIPSVLPAIIPGKEENKGKMEKQNRRRGQGMEGYSTQKRQRHLTEEDRTLARLNLREYLKLVLANLGNGSTIASDIPSISPSFISSDVPSTNPSDVPSLTPSTLPSDIPSSIPSDVPSSVPSDLPSFVPSDLPSVAPAIIPMKGENRGRMEKRNRRRVQEKKDRPAKKGWSDVPITVPSDAPSDVPSDMPSTLPSDSPSTVPSTSPTKTKKTMKERK
jgi:hypothetical protein